MVLFQRLFHLLFPPKCVLCGKLLNGEESDLCHSCRCDTPEFPDSKLKLPYLAHWTSLWYYEGTVRKSILRFKFYGQRSYAEVYGRLLAMKLLSQEVTFDILSWVPISRLRKWRRGYDQVQLIAQAVGRELGVTPTPLLVKIRNNRPQSKLGIAAKRRANVLGVYRIADSNQVKGKRILLLDDIITTGATAGECARILLTAGAKEVACATVAAAPHPEKTSR